VISGASDPCQIASRAILLDISESALYRVAAIPKSSSEKITNIKTGNVIAVSSVLTPARHDTGTSFSGK
jgi:hypothetical protein